MAKAIVYEESDGQKAIREKNFTYHKPLEGQPDKFLHIRETAKSFSHLLNTNCPPSRELALAQTKLEEAVFWANAGIARHETE